MKRILKYAVLLVVGAALYVAIEILWRGFSHRSMLAVGGICFLLVGGINNYIKWEMQLPLQILLGVLAVTAVEFVSGCFLNLGLGLDIWDYSRLPLNLLGQICVPYMLLWAPLVLVAILLDDYLRWKLFYEDKPWYPVLKYKLIMGGT